MFSLVGLVAKRQINSRPKNILLEIPEVSAGPVFASEAEENRSSMTRVLTTSFCRNTAPTKSFPSTMLNHFYKKFILA